ncbi:MAG TPA: N-acetylmuramoyl-L-alanine amidase [Anaerolineales bacterium]|nr:N-acetylmuramoyl-L-alanine amidase [Anaerolineales bacterium]
MTAEPSPANQPPTSSNKAPAQAAGSSAAPPARQRKASGGTFYLVQIVLGVAFLLATLFTAWTEPGLLPSSLSEKLEAALATQSSTPQPNWPTPTARPNPSIGIVAGHSGNDPGAVCPDELGGTREVDINLTVAQMVKESLNAEGYDVDLLAEFDPRLVGYRSLALVSIHADSCQYINDEAMGFKVAAALSTSYPEQATRLTTCLRTRYADITGMRFHAGSVTNDMTNYHAFGEINSDTPAAIIEVGFMNLDRKILTEQPDLLARGITAGILCFVRNEDISEGTTTPSTVP